MFGFNLSQPCSVFSLLNLYPRTFFFLSLFFSVFPPLFPSPPSKLSSSSRSLPFSLVFFFPFVFCLTLYTTQLLPPLLIFYIRWGFQTLISRVHMEPQFYRLSFEPFDWLCSYEILEIWIKARWSGARMIQWWKKKWRKEMVENDGKWSCIFLYNFSMASGTKPWERFGAREPRVAPSTLFFSQINLGKLTKLILNCKCNAQFHSF